MTQPKIPGNGIGIPRMPYGFDGSDWIALLVSVAGRLSIDVASLPSGAVTIADGADVTLGALADAVVAAGASGSVSAKLRRLTTDLDALLTELKLKADLTETQPVASTDGDKIFSFESVVAKPKRGAISGADGYLDSDPVLTGRVWKITNLSSWNETSASTRFLLGVVHDGTPVWFHSLTQAIASNLIFSWGGEIFLDESDVIRVEYVGAQAGDMLNLHIIGYQMNAP